MKIRRIALLATLGIAFAMEAATAASGPYQVVGTTESRERNLVRTEYTVKAGNHPLDRFKMVRLVKDVPASSLRGSIFFLPPLGTTFSFYEQRDPSGAFGTSIAEYFALRNFDVYGVSPRFEGIPAGTCEAGVLDCTVMRQWDLASMVDDAAFVRAQIELLHPGTKIVTGGASLGGILAIAVANAHPEDYDGLIVWEGILYSEDPAVRALNQGYCTALEAQLAGGVVYDGVGPNVFKEVTRNARINPSGLNMIPLFPPDLTNHQVMVMLLSTPSPGPITMPVPNYIQMNGNVAQDRLFFASDEIVYENVSRFLSYAPTAIVRDISCSLAGVETAYVAHLEDFKGAVLMIGGGRGFGAYMEDQLDQFGSTDKTLRVRPAFGHIDHMMTPNRRRVIERPILQWIERVFGGS